MACRGTALLYFYFYGLIAVPWTALLVYVTTNSNMQFVALGGLTVACRFKPGEGNGFLRAIKIGSTTYFGGK
jgi:hypothetical protein